MATDGDSEAELVAQIEADLAMLTDHVNTWLQDRFLASDESERLNLVDLVGLVTWLEQWHTHFDGYADQASPAVQSRLTEIRAQIDASIATFNQMAAALGTDQED